MLMVVAQVVQFRSAVASWLGSNIPYGRTLSSSRSFIWAPNLILGEMALVGY